MAAGSSEGRFFALVRVDIWMGGVLGWEEGNWLMCGLSLHVVERNHLRFSST